MRKLHALHMTRRKKERKKKDQEEKIEKQIIKESDHRNRKKPKKTEMKKKSKGDRKRGEKRNRWNFLNILPLPLLFLLCHHPHVRNISSLTGAIPIRCLHSKEWEEEADRAMQSCPYEPNQKGLPLKIILLITNIISRDKTTMAARKGQYKGGRI